ncbi:hypothetical protein [Methylogaea oryzae]|uniref:Uncharacterized protein n=1 Tax=Methylogaea oryzae TaxID=1295382 RepID=A0A8D4VR13_9GAMM|nr:hypothetical protein [Methylogaea oryzae]BBL71037.1 hypothetical protein MoryE10_16430 [Methylogaea oryzae]
MKDYLYEHAARLFKILLVHLDRILAIWGRHIAHGILSASVRLRAYAARRLRQLTDAVRARMGWTPPRGRRARAERQP